MTPPESARTQLLVPQRDHRIDSRGSAGRNVARDQSDNRQQQPHRGKRKGVGRADAEELRLKKACAGHGERRAQDQARQREPAPVAKNEPVDACLLRPQCHADADFPRALASGVSHHAIDADGGEQHGKKTERAGKRNRDALKK